MIPEKARTVGVRTALFPVPKYSLEEMETRTVPKRTCCMKLNTCEKREHNRIVQLEHIRGNMKEEIKRNLRTPKYTDGTGRSVYKDKANYKLGKIIQKIWI